MVYRGKPSKACLRCRGRKLHCDFQKPSCSQCLRAGAQCTGYRDTNAIRIVDQTQVVKSKALTQGDQKAITHVVSYPCHLPLDLRIQARNYFFSYYIADFSQKYDFLHSYADSAKVPDYLATTIDATSLALFSHRMHSASARELGVRQYSSALRKTKAALQSTEIAHQRATLEASLLLDLFETLMNPVFGVTTKHHRGHVNGALALVRLRGLHSFRSPADFACLARLSLNVVIACVSQGLEVPREAEEIRAYLGKFAEHNSKWNLGGLMMDMTNLLARMGRGTMSRETKLRMCRELDARMLVVSQIGSSEWAFETVSISAEQRSNMILGDYYHVYPDRTMAQEWNIRRLIRIILCDTIATCCAGREDEASIREFANARATIAAMADEICASTPSTMDCAFAARYKLSPLYASNPGLPHTHTMSHNMDVYIFFFPLHVAAWTRYCPRRNRAWILDQLMHLASHFNIKEAEQMWEILQEENAGHSKIWEAYRLLGSYAFAA